MFYSGRQTELVQALASQRRPDRKAQQQGGGFSALDALGNPQFVRWSPQPHGSGQRSPQCPLGTQEILRQIASIRLEKQPLESDNTAAILNPGQQCRPEAHIAPPSERRSRMPSQALRQSMDATVAQIDLAWTRRHIARLLPERPGDVAGSVWRKSAGRIPVRSLHGYVQRQVPDRPQDFRGRAAGEAFEKEAAVPHPHGQAGRVVVMRGATAHGPVRLPGAAKPLHQFGGRHLEGNQVHGHSSRSISPIPTSLPLQPVSTKYKIVRLSLFQSSTKQLVRRP